MTDIKSTIAELRYLADWAQHHLDKAKIANDAAEAIEALQGDLAVEIELRGKAERGLVDWCVKHMNLEAERDALQAKLDELQRQEPVAYWVPKAEQFCIADKSGRPFAKAWQPLYAAPKALEPLTQTQVVEAFCNTRHNVQYVSVFDAGVRFAEKHYGITKGTPT